MQIKMWQELISHIR